MSTYASQAIETVKFIALCMLLVPIFIFNKCAQLKWGQLNNTIAGD